MSLAVAYGMKKKMAKGGMAHSADCPGCEMCYAKGGDVKGVHKPLESLGEPGTSKAGFENERANFRSGMAKQFQRGAYHQMADEHHEAAKSEHHKVLGEMKEMSKHDRTNLAEGGEVGRDDDDLVMSIMKKRYAEGGEVSNDVGEGQDVDAMPNQFDDMVLDSDQMHDADYTGENSGDEIGDEQEDEDQRDVVAQIMKSRKKKDHLPNPR